jgi:Fe-S-cluster containining protein
MKRAHQLLTYSQAVQSAWPRMTPDEQALVMDMHAHYEREFREHKRTGAQPEGLAAGIHDVVDQMVEHLMQTAPKAPEVKCRRFCSHCCHVNVTITREEALLLHHAASEAGITLDRDKLARQAKRTHADWRELDDADRGCVFLDQMGGCRVYEHRPSACRKYHVISDPDLCDMKKYPDGDVLNFVSIPAEIVQSAALTVFEAGNMAAMLLKHEPKQ